MYCQNNHCLTFIHVRMEPENTPCTFQSVISEEGDLHEWKTIIYIHSEDRNHTNWQQSSIESRGSFSESDNKANEEMY